MLPALFPAAEDQRRDGSRSDPACAPGGATQTEGWQHGGAGNLHRTPGRE